MEKCVFVEKYDPTKGDENPCMFCKDVIKVYDSFMYGWIILGCKLNKEMYYTKIFNSSKGFCTHGIIFKSY